MKALIIIGCVLLYIVIGTIVAFIARDPFDDDVELFFITMFWPLFATFGMLWFIFVVIPKWIIDYFD